LLNTLQCSRIRANAWIADFQISTLASIGEQTPGFPLAVPEHWQADRVGPWAGRIHSLPKSNLYVTIYMKIHLEEYIRENGSNPYQTWFNTLSTQAAVKITVAKARLELGNTSNIKWFRGIGEYKIDWGPGYRIYLAKDGDTMIILFGGSTKKDQQKAIDQAIALHEEFQYRKKALTRKAKKP
jgi:putative addiction module killer protein